jgi:hypothetical protein
VFDYLISEDTDYFFKFLCWVHVELRQMPQKAKGKAVPLHAMEALGGRGGIAPTHSRPRH